MSCAGSSFAFCLLYFTFTKESSSFKYLLMLIDLFANFEKKLNNIKNLESIKSEDLNYLKYNAIQQEYFIKEKIEKQKIVLHHTVGNIYGDFVTLTSQKQVGVAYLIGRTGTIIELFNPDYWSNHLGKTALGGNREQSKISIGIEISNYGYLIRKDDILYTIYGTEYCKISDTKNYEIKEYRGQKYWAKYTEEQYIAIKNLLKKLTKQYNIPYEFLPINERMEYTKSVISFKGIVTHVNYRKDKWDVSPIFDWSKISNI